MFEYNLQKRRKLGLEAPEALTLSDFQKSEKKMALQLPVSEGLFTATSGLKRIST
jgi:hypothetical protein